MSPCPIVAHASRVCWCALALLTMAPACASKTVRVACDASDRVAQGTLGAALLDCTKRLHECTTLECVDATEDECNALGERVCRE